MKEKNSKNLEQLFNRLNEIKQTLQSGSVSLDDIVPLVQEAEKIYKELSSGLESVRKIITDKNEKNEEA